MSADRIELFKKLRMFQSVDIADAADILGLSKGVLRKWIRLGRVGTFKIGAPGSFDSMKRDRRLVRIPVVELTRLVEHRPARAAVSNEATDRYIQHQ